LAKKLTPQQRALVKNLVKGMSITEAARSAGYADNGYVGQLGSQALERMRLTMPELLDKHGLTDDALIENYLKPALQATETKFAQFEGQFTDEREVLAWGPRLTALDMAHKLKGSYASKSVDELSAANVTINLNSFPRRA
jgi:phage terminase small subunit